MTPGTRERVDAAVVDLVLEKGYLALDMESIAAAARVGEAELTALYADPETAFLTVWEEIAIEVRDTIREAMERPGSWRERLRGSGLVAAEWTNANRRRMRFMMVEVQFAGSLARAYLDQWLNDFIDLLDEGRQELEDPDSIGRAVAEMTVGSVFALIVARAQEGDGEQDARLWLPEILYMGVRPYLGDEAAKEELASPPFPETGS